jgi:glutaredoxin 3
MRGSPFVFAAVAAVVLSAAGLVVLKLLLPPAAAPPPVEEVAPAAPEDRPAVEDPAQREAEAHRAAVAERRRLALEEATRGRAAPRAVDRKRLGAAMRSVSVTMYTTSWCPVCTRARAFLRSRGVPFVERDVERDAEARRIMLRLNPNAGVPTIDVEGQILLGFSPRELAGAIESAARRRQSL